MTGILLEALFATIVGILLSGRGARGPDGSAVRNAESLFPNPESRIPNP